MYNLKLAIRNLLRQRTGTLINVIGLSLSLAVCFLITLFVQYEYSFEKHNPDAKNMYRLLNVEDAKRDPIHPIAFFQPIKDAVPELKNGVMVQYQAEDYFVVDNEQMMLKNVFFSDNNFFKLFHIKMLEGGAEPLLDAYSVVISRSEAEKLFPHSSAIGKTLRFQNRHDFQIKGVFKDTPTTANYRPNVIMNIHAKKTLQNFEYTSMQNQSTHFYFLLPENAILRTLKIKYWRKPKFRIIILNINTLLLFNHLKTFIFTRLTRFGTLFNVPMRKPCSCLSLLPYLCYSLPRSTL